MPVRKDLFLFGLFLAALSYAEPFDQYNSVYQSSSLYNYYGMQNQPLNVPLPSYYYCSEVKIIGNRWTGRSMYPTTAMGIARRKVNYNVAHDYETINDELSNEACRLAKWNFELGKNLGHYVSCASQCKIANSNRPCSCDNATHEGLSWEPECTLVDARILRKNTHWVYEVAMQVAGDFVEGVQRCTLSPRSMFSGIFGNR